jgi:hypothetical protein
LRTISLAAAGGLRPRLAGGFGAGFVAAAKADNRRQLGFPVLRFFVDIVTPTPRILWAMFAEKCLKKVSLVAERSNALTSIACRKGAARSRVSLLTQIAFTWQNRRAHAGLRRPSRMHKECGNARVRANIRQRRQGYRAVGDGSGITPVHQAAPRFARMTS